jgi:hypothetical protein
MQHTERTSDEWKPADQIQNSVLSATSKKTACQIQGENLLGK